MTFKKCFCTKKDRILLIFETKVKIRQVGFCNKVPEEHAVLTVKSSGAL